MKHMVAVLILGLFLAGSNVRAQDNILIDQNGNIITGASGSGHLEVTGGSAETAVLGIATDTGGDGVEGRNTTYGNFGILGGFNGGTQIGVYGFVNSGYAGYFDGDTYVNANLTVDGDILFTGTLTGYNESDPTVNALAHASLGCSEGQVAKMLGGLWTCAADNNSGTTYTAGTGLDLTGNAFSVEVPLYLSSSSTQYTVHGYNTGTGGYGIRGGSTGLGGAGVFGVTYDATGAGKGVYGFADNSSTAGYFHNNSSGTAGYFTSASGTAGYFTSASGYGLVVENGNVGIGTVTPHDLLEVKGALRLDAGAGNGNILRFVEDNVKKWAILYRPWAGDSLGIWDEVGSKWSLFFESNTGRVGVGTTAPGEKLSVAGTVESTSGGFKFPDGTVQTSARYGGSAVVATSGGDYADPGAAMDNIAVWCGTPSSTNLCMMKIMPGIYDLGTDNLVMQEYVDIEGSGEHVTILTSSISGLGTVIGADNSEIRFLAINHTGNSGIGIYNEGASPRITNVTVNATAPASCWAWAMRNMNYAYPRLTNVSLYASGGYDSFGMSNYLSLPEMNNVKVTAYGGTHYTRAIQHYSLNTDFAVWKNLDLTAEGGASNIGLNASFGTVRINNSAIKGTTQALAVDSPSSNKYLYISGSMINGSVLTDASTTIRCIASFGLNYNSLNSSCQ